MYTYIVIAYIYIPSFISLRPLMRRMDVFVCVVVPCVHWPNDRDGWTPNDRGQQEHYTMGEQVPLYLLFTLLSVCL